MTTAILLSGGVDSSVALWRLAEEGAPNLRAYYLKVWLEDELAFAGECPWEDDLRSARAVCEILGVELEVVSLQREYYARVVAGALEELRAGRTPSPDIFCNRRVKFGAFRERVGDEVDVVATGHYARVERDASARPHLLRGVDPVKDQSYFLSRLDGEQLARLRFPIGHLPKREVRRLAREAGLPNQDRPDSQGICFLGKIRYDDFVRAHLGERPGPIVEEETGRVLGEHRGPWFHTIGQRRGLGLSGGPWFVTGKDLARSEIRVTHADHLARHARRGLRAEDLHWIAGPPRRPRLEVKLRHGERRIGCRIERLPESALRVELDEGDTGVAPGQYVVFYDGEECLGSGRIA